MKIRLPFALAFASLFFISGHAQQQYKSAYKVTVEVASSDKDGIKNEVISYIGRELRSLKDITIVDSEPDAAISIIALKVQNKHSGITTGYALSILATEPISESAARTLISQLAKSDDVSTRPPLLTSLEEAIISLFTKREEIKHHSLLTGPDLKELCSDAVTKIDSKVFEEWRKIWRTLDTINSRNSSTKP